MQGRFERMAMGDGAEIAVYHVMPAGDTAGDDAPDGSGPARRGGLVVVQEIFGVTDHIRCVADRWAADGYEVMAPALFDREHPGFEGSYTGRDLERGIELARELHPFEQSLADVQTCVDVLEPHGPVFVVGFCYGASVAWISAARGTGIAAAASYYGSQVPLTDAAPRVPTIAHFGRHDAGIPVEGVEALIASHPANADIYLYDAGHGFASDRRRDWHEPSATLARERTLALFRANEG